MSQISILELETRNLSKEKLFEIQGGGGVGIWSRPQVGNVSYKIPKNIWNHSSSGISSGISITAALYNVPVTTSSSFRPLGFGHSTSAARQSRWLGQVSSGMSLGLSLGF